jgi:hypothetical protein
MDKNHEVQSEENKRRLRGATVGFVHHLREHITKREPPRMTEAAAAKLKAMAQFIAVIRARTRQDRETKEFVKSRVEIPTRLISILVKTAVCVAIVLERADIDEEVLRIVKKITFDTLDSVELDIVNILHRNPDGLSLRQISTEFGLTERAILNRLQQLKYFGAVRNASRTNNSGQRGRDVHIWKLADSISTIYATALDALPGKAKSSRTPKQKLRSPKRPKSKAKV